jgi:hypothetical protein
MRYWQQAGERAVQRSANTEAMGHYTKAFQRIFSPNPKG